ncbi:MAG: DUF2087 domain-containing protein [Candidatus Izemoplasmataceae bacterium]
MDSIKLFKVLSDKSRINIILSLKEEDMVVERIAKRLNLAASTTSFHLKKLEDIGLVKSKKEQYYKIYTLQKSFLSKTLEELLTLKEDPQVKTREERYIQNVLDTFMENGRIIQIPVQRKKRLILLDQIIQDFEENKIYTEQEVNDIVIKYHEDYCLLRRELVDFRYLKRTKNTYQLLSKNEKKS